MVRLLFPSIIAAFFVFQVGCSFDMEIEDLVELGEGDLDITQVGEKASFAPGESVTITWDRKGDVRELVDTVAIEYSSDDGENWTTITKSAPNSGEYVWTSPDTESPDYIVRILANYNDKKIRVASNKFGIDKTPPTVGVDQPVVTNEDTAVDFALSDPSDNQTAREKLVGNIVTPPANGALTGCLQGVDGTTTETCTYTPNANFFGVDSFTYRVKDIAGWDSAAFATVTITVNAVNDIPVVTATCPTNFAEDTAYPGCTPSVTDIETGDTHDWSLGAANTCAWAGINPATGVVFGTPNNIHVGTCNLSIVANDGTDPSVPVDTTITVTNTAPTMTIADAANISEDFAAQVIRLDGTVQASDEGQGTTAYSFDHAATTGTRCSDNATTLVIDSNNGAVTYQPSANYYGTCNIRVAFSDGNGGTVTDQFSITVDPINDIPVVSSTCSTSASEDAAYTCTPTLVDPDPDTQTWSFAAGHTCSWLAINPTNGVITGTPGDADIGSCALRFRTNDGTVFSNTESYTIVVINVNDIPIASSACSTSATEDSAYSCTPGVTDDDVADTHAWTLDGTNDCGWAAIDPSSGVVSGTPDNSHVGSCTLAFRANDGTANSNVESYSVTVSNTVPTLTIADASNIAEDAGPSAIRLDADVAASDEAQGTTTYSFDHATTSSPKCSDNAISLTIDATTGVVTYQPAANYEGTCSIKVAFDDGHGGTVDDEFDITVDGANDTPVITSTCATAVNEDAAYTTCTPGVTDPDTGDTHTWAFDSSNDCAWATINPASGVIDGTPDNSHVGSCTLAFKANDGTIDSNVETYTVTVTNVAPTLVIGDAAAINEDAVAAVIRNDAAVAASDEGQGTTTYGFDHATTTATKCSDNANSLTIDGSTGAVTFAPAADFSGSCNIKVSFSDGNGATVDDEFAILVNAVNDAPVITSSCATTATEDVAYPACVPGVTDPDSGDTHTWAFDGSHTCSWMAIDPSSGTVTGTPANADVGTCTLAFKANDGTTDSNIQSYSVTVDNVNDAPIITSACTTSLNEDVAYSCTPGLTDIDPGPDTQTWTFAAGHDCNWMSINSSTGVVTGTPVDDDVGSCTLTFKSNDGTVDSNIRSHTVTVNNVVPTLTIADAANISEDMGAVTIRTDGTVQASDETWGVYSLDNSTTTAPKCSDNAISLAVDAVTGAVTYNPAADYNGTCNIKVSFDDGNGGVVADEFQVTVDNANDPPVITSSCTTTLNQDVAYSCTPGVTDPDSSDTHTWSLSGANTCGWVSIHPSTGVISGTPDDDDVGDCILSFLANDGSINSNVEGYSITVNNIAPTLTIADAANIAEDAASSVIRVDATVQASEEGMGIYMLDNPGTTGTKCSDNAIALSIDASTGAVTYQPAADYYGTCNIRVVFDDENNLPNSLVAEEFSITVTPVNDQPVISSTCTTSLNQDVAYSCTPSVIDPDPTDTHTWSFTGSNDCSWLAISSTTGAITGTPDDEDVGTCTLEFRVSDGTINSTATNYTVTVNNIAPTLTIADAADILEDAAATVIRANATVQASEEGHGVYSFNHAGTTGTKCSDNALSLTINASNGAVTYRPAANYFGTCNVRVVFDDQNSEPNSTVEAQFAINVNSVNDIPVITGACATTATQDSAYTCNPGVTDVDDVAFTWSFAAGNTCTWLAINGTTGALTGTPAYADTGTCSLRFRVHDGEAFSVTEVVSITVTPLPAPTISSIVPNTGPSIGGTDVVISGANYRNPTVTIGGNACLGVVLISSSEIRCRTQAHAVGAVNVVVTNSDTQNVISAGAYTFTNDIDITKVRPVRASTMGGELVTVIGNGFDAGATVRINGVACTSSTRVDSTKMTCIAPVLGAGTYAVSVHNPDATNDSLGSAIKITNGVWSTTVSTTGAPGARSYLPSVWAGNKMVVWGGNNSSALNTGAVYDPVANSWSAITSSGALSTRWHHSGVWTGTHVIYWGGYSGSADRGDGKMYDVANNQWVSMTSTGAPSARRLHQAVWTGDEMIIWGGYSGAALAGGARYNPNSNTWSSISTTNQPSARWATSSIWTGKYMFIWGGLGASVLSDGRLYDPIANTWTTISTSSAPSSRHYHSAVWTGKEVIVWGGKHCTDHATACNRADGRKYNPSSNSWSTVSATGAPSGRYWHSAVWTGRYMYLFGGAQQYATSSSRIVLNDSYIYDPEVNRWSAVSGTPVSQRGQAVTVWTGSQVIVWSGYYSGYYSPGDFRGDGKVIQELAPLNNNTWGGIVDNNAPTARVDHTMVWTGRKAIVWGGYNLSAALNNGKVYDPVADSWSTMTTSGAPSARYGHSAVWTGQKMVVWGGYNGTSALNNGAQYDPESNAWSALATSGAPSARAYHTAIWADGSLLVWGGWNGTAAVSTGAVWTPNASAGTWSAMASGGQPVARWDHSAIFANNKVMVWGGLTAAGTATDTGGVYDPVANSWSSMTTSGSPSGRHDHTAVRLSNYMVVWGGNNGSDSPAGGGAKYDEALDSWAFLSGAGEPSDRFEHAAVSYGNKMMVWGGWNGTEYFNDGAVYDEPTNSWTSMSTDTDFAKHRRAPAAVYTGAVRDSHGDSNYSVNENSGLGEILIWGGRDNVGVIQNGMVYQINQ